MSKRPLTNRAGEVRELDEEDMRAMRPAADVLPDPLVKIIPKRRPGERGPQKAPTKKQVTVRLDADVLSYLKSGGPGWQPRMNAMLRKAMSGKLGINGNKKTERSAIASSRERRKAG
jgi:uncharacterized protein (DUF4415 family)